MAPPKDRAHNAIALRGVGKQFQKRTVRREYTTLKSELVRWLKREKRPRSLTHLTALHDVNLEVPVGKTVGIIGRNGAGKSTLLKLITGIYAPTGGEIEVNGRISALLELGAGFHPDFSGRENILINGIILGMTRAEALAKTEEIVAFSELGDFIDEPVRTYSSGMYMRLAFSVATHVDPDILIVDEILAVGDAHFAHKSLGKMTEFKQRGKTIVLVTHDLATVQQWCDLAAWLDKGTIRAVGTPQEIVQQYQAEVARAEVTAEPAAMRLGTKVSTLEPREPTLGPKVPWAQRYGSFAVEVSQVRLLGPDGAPATVLKPQDRLVVELTCVAHAPVADVSVGVTFRREDGMEVFGTTSRAHGAVLNLPVGKPTPVRLVLDRNGLGPAAYRLDVSVQEASGADLDCQLGLYALQIVSELHEGGVMRPPRRWEVGPPPA